MDLKIFLHRSSPCVYIVCCLMYKCCSSSQFECVCIFNWIGMSLPWLTCTAVDIPYLWWWSAPPPPLLTFTFLPQIWNKYRLWTRLSLFGLLIHFVVFVFLCETFGGCLECMGEKKMEKERSEWSVHFFLRLGHVHGYWPTFFQIVHLLVFLNFIYVPSFFSFFFL